MKNRKISLTLGITLFLAGIATAQLGQILKVGGVVAAVKVFGKQMNEGLNKLINHKDSPTSKTKVVVILSAGIGTPTAVGAAQVVGDPSKVDQVVAVAQPEASLLGKEVRIRGLIPVASQDISKGLKTVSGVAVSGLVDIKL